MPEQVGIVITAEDSSKPGFASARKGADGLEKKYGSLKGSMGNLTMGVIGLNQALGLAKRAWSMVSQAVGGAIRDMLEMRGANDPVSRQFAELEKDAKTFKATLGNLLTPIILGFAKAWRTTGSAVTDYINANRKLIATNLIEWLSIVASALTTGVAQGLIWVSKAVSGLILLWNLLKAAVNTYFEVSTRGVEMVLRGMTALAKAAGKEGLAASLNESIEAVALLADTFGESATENIAAIENEITRQEAFEENIKKAETAVRKFGGEAKVAMLQFASGLDEVGVAVTGTRVALGGAFSSAFASQAAYYEQQNVLLANEAAFQAQLDASDERLAKQRELAASAKEKAIELGTALGMTFAAIVTGTKAAGEAMAALGSMLVSTMVDAIGNVIIAEAAKAAAGAASGMFSIPIIGPALAAGAAAAAFGMVKGMLSLLPKAEHGGVLTSGFSSGDMNIVRMNRNELTMPPDVASAFRRVMAMDGNRGGPQDQKPTVVQHISYNSIGPMLSADAERSARANVKLMRRAGFAVA